jgi:integrase
MATTDAIKDTADIRLLENYFRYKGNDRMASLFKFGLNVALRITDLLSIKFTDIKNNRLIITEQKTGKTRNIPLNPTAKKAVEALRELSPEAVYLFQTAGNRAGHLVKPISRQYVLAAFKQAAADNKLPLNIGTHSLRKTYGYHQYTGRGKSLGMLMTMFGHSSEAVTRRYIGVTQDDIDAAYLELEL